jgi:hypothetical protein
VTDRRRPDRIADVLGGAWVFVVEAAIVAAVVAVALLVAAGVLLLT